MVRALWLGTVSIYGERGKMIEGRYLVWVVLLISGITFDRYLFHPIEVFSKITL
jgi:hypothetical protein